MVHSSAACKALYRAMLHPSQAQHRCISPSQLHPYKGLQMLQQARYNIAHVVLELRIELDIWYIQLLGVHLRDELLGVFVVTPLLGNHNYRSDLTVLVHHEAIWRAPLRLVGLIWTRLVQLKLLVQRTNNILYRHSCASSILRELCLQDVFEI